MTNHAKLAVSLVLGFISIVGFAGHAAADNSVSPSSFSFVSFVGGASPAAQTLTVTPFAATTSWTASTDGSPWLSLMNTSGTGNGTVTILVSTGTLAAGAYNATITVMFAGSPTNLIETVSFNVAPSQVNFSGNLGGSNPPSQTLQVLVSGSAASSLPITWTATVSTSSGGNWLNVSPPSLASTGGSMQPLTVSATVAGLAVGTYNGTITVSNSTFVGGNNTAFITPVALTIGTPAVTVSPTLLTFTGNAGGSPPTSQKVTVTSASGWLGSVSITGTSGNWLSISPGLSTAAGSSTFSVTADPSKLTASTTPYMGTITVSPIGSGVPVIVSVSFTVSAPAVTVAPTSLAFNATFGPTSPQPQTVTVTAASGWSGSVTTTTGGNWLSIVPVSGTTSGTFSVTVNSSILSGGQTYTGTINVTPAGSGTPVPIGVTVNVAGPVISVTPLSLTFTQVEGQIALSQAVMLGATPAVSNWSAAITLNNSTIPWLNVSPGSGSFPQPTSIYPNAQATGLTAAGSPYTATVTFTDSNASPTSLTVQVTLNVTALPAPLLTVGQPSVTVQGTPGNGPQPYSTLIGNSGTGSLNWTAAVIYADATTNNPIPPEGAWLTPSALSGSASAHVLSPISLKFASNLNPGVYNAVLTVTAGTQKQNIVVSYVVGPPQPQLNLGTRSLLYIVNSYGPVARGDSPAPQTVYLSNSGSAAMIYSLSVFGHILLPIQGPTTVSAGGSSSFPVPLDLYGAQQTGTGVLAGGSTSGLIQLTYAAASNPSVTLGTAYIGVVLYVTPQIGPNTATLSPTATILTPSNLSDTITVTASSSTQVVFGVSAQSQGNWLQARASSSRVTGLTPTTIAVNAVPSLLPTQPGIYMGTVSVSFLGGSGIPSQDITVYLVIPKTSAANVQARSGEPRGGLHTDASDPGSPAARQQLQFFGGLAAEHRSATG